MCKTSKKAKNQQPLQNPRRQVTNAVIKPFHLILWLRNNKSKCVRNNAGEHVLNDPFRCAPKSNPLRHSSLWQESIWACDKHACRRDSANIWPSRHQYNFNLRIKTTKINLSFLPSILKLFGQPKLNWNIRYVHPKVQMYSCFISTLNVHLASLKFTVCVTFPTKSLIC